MKELIKEAYSLLVDYPNEARKIVRLSGFDTEDMENEVFSGYMVELEDAEDNLRQIKEMFSGEPDNDSQVREATQAFQVAHYNLRNFVKNHPRFDNIYKEKFWHLDE